MGKVGTFEQTPRRPIDTMALAALLAVEHSPAFDVRAEPGGGATALVQPGVEVGRLHDDDREGHACMRGTAEFGALAAISAGLGRAKRHAVDASRDQIHLAAKRRNPERMDHVAACQLKLHTFPRRQAYFVGRDHRAAVLTMVEYLPPDWWPTISTRRSTPSPPANGRSDGISHSV